VPGRPSPYLTPVQCLLPRQRRPARRGSTRHSVIKVVDTSGRNAHRPQRRETVGLWGNRKDGSTHRVGQSYAASYFPEPGRDRVLCRKRGRRGCSPGRDGVPTGYPRLTQTVKSRLLGHGVAHQKGGWAFWGIKVTNPVCPELLGGRPGLIKPFGFFSISPDFVSGRCYVLHWITTAWRISASSCGPPAPAPKEKIPE